MAKQSTAQKKTVGRVMHEWKHGELESSRGGKVKNRRQAVAIALSEAGHRTRRRPDRTDVSWRAPNRRSGVARPRSSRRKAAPR